MNEPFKIVKREEYSEIPSFSATKLIGEYWSSYLNITDPKPISDALNEIFDKGNKVHNEDEVLNHGARRVVSCEKYIKAIHESEFYAISGFHDYIKISFKGLYIEDLKSCQPGGLYYFLKEGIGKTHVLQLSFYAYLYYIETGVFISTGVITKIDKENTLRRISLATQLYPPAFMRDWITNHPLILSVIGKISEEEFLEKCYHNIKELAPDYFAGKRKSIWLCGNCQYKPCKLMKYMKEEEYLPK